MVSLFTVLTGGAVMSGQTSAKTGDDGVGRNGPLLRLSFDGTLQPLFSDDSKKEFSIEGGESSNFADGISNKAVVLASQSLKYKIGFSGLSRYAISFWLSPLDWRGSDEKDRKFMTLVGGKGKLELLRLPGKQAKHDVNGPYAGMGRLQVSVEKQAPLQLMWYMEEWNPGPYNTPEYIGNTDFSRIPMEEWVPGKWHHIVINVDRFLRQVDFYIDGCQMAITKEISVVEDLKEVVFEGNASGKTLYDDFMVLQFPVGAGEAEYLFKQKGNSPFPIPAAVALSPQIYSEYMVLDQKLTVGVDARGKADAVEIQIRKGNEKVQAQKVEKGQCGYFEAIFDVRSLPKGDFDLVGELKKGHELAGEVKTPFSKKDDTTWEKMKAIGKEEVVLKPWTPLEVQEGKVVKCWGREYHLDGEKGFLTRMVSQGKDILSAPIRLEVKSQGKTLEWSPSRVEWEKKSPAAVVWKTFCRDRQKQIELTSVYRMEFDGTIFLDMKLSPLIKGIPLERVALVIPFQPDFATYFSYNNEVYSWEDKTGIIHMADFGKIFPEKASFPLDQIRTQAGSSVEGNKRSMGFLPWLYLGNQDLGFCYATEEMKNWVTDKENEKKMVEVVKEENGTVLYLNLVRRNDSFSLEDALTWTIALQATPVKPVYPENVRDRRIARHHEDPFYRVSNVTHPSMNCNEAWYTKWGYGCGNRVRDELGIKKVVDFFHQKGCLYYPHAVFQYGPFGEPEVREYYDEFARSPSWGVEGVTLASSFFYAEARKDRDMVGFDYFRREKGNIKETAFIPPVQLNGYSCPGSQRYQDYLVWCHKYAVENFGWDGVHFDVEDIYPCMSEKHGCQYVDINGRKRPRWPIFAHRQVLKRILACYQQQGMEPVLSAAANTRCTISSGFLNDIQTGEWWMFAQRKKPGVTMLDVMDLDDFAAYLTPAPTGIPTTLAHGQSTEAPDNSTAVYCMLTLLLDFNLLGMQNQVVIQEAMRVKTKFGMTDTDYLPYWKIMGNGVIVKSSSKVLVSLYPKKALDKVLVIIGNTDDKESPFAMEMNMKKLGLKAKGVLKDGFTGKIVSEQPNFQGNLKKGEFRLLFLE